MTQCIALPGRGSAWRLAGQGSRAGQGQPVSGLPSDLRYGVAFPGPARLSQARPHPSAGSRTKYRKLGRSGLDVSLIGLGTMTWGEQNTEAEAHEQLDYALARGINLIDTAEMYPVPPLAQTQGLTETYIGTWLASRKRRQDVVLASKVAGPVRDPSVPATSATARLSWTARTSPPRWMPA